MDDPLRLVSRGLDRARQKLKSRNNGTIGKRGREQPHTIGSKAIDLRFKELCQQQLDTSFTPSLPPLVNNGQTCSDHLIKLCQLLYPLQSNNNYTAYFSAKK